MADFSQQVDQYLTAVNSHADKLGAGICEAVYNSSRRLLEGLEYLRVSESTDTAGSLLSGTQGAVVEVAGCLSLGLVRPALFSLRAQVDMLLSWLYFKDHAIEWRHVEETGSGFMLKRDVFTYMETYNTSFKQKFSVLKQVKTRQEEDPYRLLSAHVHSQSSFSVPAVGNLDTLVSDKKQCEECVCLQDEVTEYLCDVIVACYGSKWASLPDSIVEQTRSRLSATQCNVVFS